MTIKEVEELLGLPRATVRFYEKEELLTPQRNRNAYREYSEDDIAVLKKIIILRKLGFSVSEIKDFLEEKVPLQELLEKNILELQEKMNELNGALKICRKMQNRQEDLDSFNENFYWEEIHAQEQAGNKFLEIVNDSIYYEKQLFYKYFDLADEEGKLRYSKKEIIYKVLKYLMVLGAVFYILDGIRGEWSVQNFLRGFIQPVLVIGVMSLFGLPWHLFKKKFPEIAQEYGLGGYVVVMTILVNFVLIMLALIFLT